ncbi:hypothetical protein LguiB_005342 [Lonicera macranthoides]
MEYAQQTLSDILLTYPQDYFWSKSQKTDAFRFSTIFTKFIKQYIKMLQQAHASRRLHQWGNSLCDEIVINHNDFQNISFQNAPVEPEEGDDFDELKKLDYSNLASLVEHVHWACSLPKISDNSSPELLAFLGVLKHSDIYDETFIRTHYSLWSFKKRDTFMRTIQSKQEYRRFQEMTDSEFNTLAPFKFSKRFRKGFWVVYDDDQFMHERVYNKIRTSTSEKKLYKNDFASFLKFVHKMFAYHNVGNRNNPFGLADMEWRIYEEFPFYLKLVCDGAEVKRLGIDGWEEGFFILFYEMVC